MLSLVVLCLFVLVTVVLLLLFVVLLLWDVFVYGLFALVSYGGGSLVMVVVLSWLNANV